VTLAACVLASTSRAGDGAPLADLAVSATTSPDPVAPGAPISVTVTATNLGPDASPATSVVSLFFQGFLAAPTAGCVEVLPIVRCEIGRLAAGAQSSVTIRYLIVPGTTQTVENSLGVEGTAPDPDPENNTIGTHTSLATHLRPHAELAHGSVLVGSALEAEGTAGDFHRLRQRPFSSYEVVLDGASGDIGDPYGGPLGNVPNPVLLERVALDGTTVLQAATGTGAGAVRSLRFANRTSSVIDDQTIRVRAGTWPFAGDASDQYRLRAYDTTYTVARFASAGPRQTVLVVQNPTPRPVELVARFWSEAGVLLATHAPAVLAPRASMELHTAGIPELAGTAGSITIENDAPYAALAGTAVSLEPLTGFAFATPLQPRPR
jgi:hypothetical protein